MTTFSYTLVLDDTESSALEAALDMLLDRCEHELAARALPIWHGNKAPVVSRVASTNARDKPADSSLILLPAKQVSGLPRLSRTTEISRSEYIGLLSI